MSLDFLKRHGARRMSAAPDQPLRPLPDPDADGGAPESAGGPRLDLERPPDEWAPIDVRDADIDLDETPRRFVDGSFVHTTAAWLRDDVGHPVPVLLAEIGAVCLRADGPRLHREAAVVERVVSFCVDPFPWHEVEDFARALAATDLRLLPATLPLVGADGSRAAVFDFERMREQTRVACRRGMELLEESVAGDLSVPTLVDGRLGTYQRIAGIADRPIVGVVKQQVGDYLHDQGWRTLYGLEPGRRTPAFLLSSKDLPVATWYLKLDGADGTLPNWGVVRVEVPQARWHRADGGPGFADRLSRSLCNIRCRPGRYARGPVSLEPIVRAEDSIKSLFAPNEALAHKFYHIAGL